MSPVYINTVSHPAPRPPRTTRDRPEAEQPKNTRRDLRLATALRENLRCCFARVRAQRSSRRLSEIADSQLSRRECHVATDVFRAQEAMHFIPLASGINLLPKQLRLIMELDGIHERDIEGPPYGPKP
ncbi:hypothetical protein CISG_07457 [Coccidioides immitis RMSCC 3703]|uniref:Uncharacterized protein n=1 Tax=Coccidioides immitis RMSCC 3703 TaxID=454286 RepID=A0A0J8R3Z9_COCIT|nr:hypothetical protein CISG_07457 [Coccidioides immitis RMSCC 3703]